jgi:hypothetical protein
MIFSLFNMSLNRFESICTTFKKEAEKIQYNSDYAHENDRQDQIRSAFILKELTTEMILECANKKKCLIKMQKKENKGGIICYEAKSKI